MSKYCCHCLNEIQDGDSVCPFCKLDQIDEVPVHHIAVGTVLRERYVVGKAIGEGGFGITYIGKDLLLNIKVAIKEFFPNGYVNRNNTVSMAVYGSTSEDRRSVFDKGKERFLYEARILAMFSKEPGIVDVKDFFETNNTAYIVMEYLEGQTLKQLLVQKGRYTPEEIWTMLTPVMRSLSEIHKCDLIHRDISPDNIMCVDNTLKLLDFGAARNVSAAANKSLSVMLKPGYAPEEQYRSKGKQGAWTDVYALSATIYKCITGITPDDSTERIIDDSVKTPSALGISISTNFEQALMKGLAVLQKDRFQSVDEFISAVNGETMSVPTDSEVTIIPVDAVDKDKTILSDEGLTVVGDADDSETVFADENLTVLGEVDESTENISTTGTDVKEEISVIKDDTLENTVLGEETVAHNVIPSVDGKPKGRLVSSYRRVIEMKKEDCHNPIEILMPDETMSTFDFCDEFSVSNQKKYIVVCQKADSGEYLFFVFRNRYGKNTLISEGQDQKKVYRWFREKHGDKYEFTDEKSVIKSEKKKKHFAQDTAPRLFPTVEDIPQVLELPDKYEHISPYAFSKLNPNGKEVRQIIISGSVEVIDDNAFNGLVVTEAVFIPNTVKRIGDNAFTLKKGAYIYCEGNSRAYRKYCDGELKVVKDIPFKSSASKTDVILFELSKSKDVTRIKSGTIPFSLNTEVDSILIPEGICVLDENALSNAKVRQKIVIPDSVTRIGRYAFSLMQNAYVECSETSFAYVYCKENGIHNSVDISKFYRSKGVCAHCGGKFSGLFRKKCSKCGITKDY